jgi:hypothetical protein
MVISALLNILNKGKVNIGPPFCRIQVLQYETDGGLYFLQADNIYLALFLVISDLNFFFKYKKQTLSLLPTIVQYMDKICKNKLSKIFEYYHVIHQ